MQPNGETSRAAAPHDGLQAIMGEGLTVKSVPLQGLSAHPDHLLPFSFPFSLGYTGTHIRLLTAASRIARCHRQAKQNEAD